MKDKEHLSQLVKENNTDALKKLIVGSSGVLDKENAFEIIKECVKQDNMNALYKSTDTALKTYDTSETQLEFNSLLSDIVDLLQVERNPQQAEVVVRS